jgi:hypothetical protein
MGNFFASRLHCSCCHYWVLHCSRGICWLRNFSALPFHSLASSSYFCRVFAALGLLRIFGAPPLVDSVEVLSNLWPLLELQVYSVGGNFVKTCRLLL